MSHFYGIVKGAADSQATRRGDKSTGLGVTAASHQGAVTVDLYVKDGEDWAKIWLIPWEGKGIHQFIYHGPVGGLGLDDRSDPAILRQLEPGRCFAGAQSPKQEEREKPLPLTNAERAEEADAQNEEYRRTGGRMKG